MWHIGHYITTDWTNIFYDYAFIFHCFLWNIQNNFLLFPFAKPLSEYQFFVTFFITFLCTDSNKKRKPLLAGKDYGSFDFWLLTCPLTEKWNFSWNNLSIFFSACHYLSGLARNISKKIVPKSMLVKIEHKFTCQINNQHFSMQHSISHAA